MDNATFTPLPRGTFSTVVADPPWPFGDKLPGKGRGAATHYETLSMDDIATFGEHLRPSLRERAHLYLWVPNAFMAAQSERVGQIIEAWGFSGKTVLTWVKLLAGAAVTNGDRQPRRAGWIDENDVATGMGHYFRGSSEQVVFATRGRALEPGVRNQRTVFFAPRRQHSEKPDEFYDLVREMSKGPRVDLFARRRVDGFSGWGVGL